MRLSGRTLRVLFTLLLAVQGEPVWSARTKVIVRSVDRPVPEQAYGVCVPVRLSRDGVPVCVYDARLADGAAVAALTRDELAARGIRPLDEVLAGWRERELRLFLELCRPAAETLSEEARAERELILSRAGAGVPPAFAEEAPCSCEALADEALQTAYRAGFRQGAVWLVTDDAAVFARYGGKSSGVPVCCLSADGAAVAGARGLLLHRSQVASKTGVKRLRRGGRRVAVWDVNSAEDAAAMGACGVDFIVTDDPASIVD